MVLHECRISLAVCGAAIVGMGCVWYRRTGTEVNLSVVSNFLGSLQKLSWFIYLKGEYVKV